MVVLLKKEHNRDSFDCGQDKLNAFLKNYALQNMRTGFSKTHVLLKKGERDILGYYTLTADSLKRDDIPERVLKKLPKYPPPAILLSRLAIDSQHVGKGYGKRLLMDCLRRVLFISEHTGVFALVVDAKDQAAKSFYLQYGFSELLDDSLHLYLPLYTIRRILGL